MSSLIYDDHTHILTLYDSAGAQVGQWQAFNNADSRSKGPFPSGEFPYEKYNPHEGANANSPYGSNGNFMFKVPNRSDMGVHSGRSVKADGLGRSGPGHATQGCIRTTDDATAAIKQLHRTDPLTLLTVRH